MVGDSPSLASKAVGGHGFGFSAFVIGLDAFRSECPFVVIIIIQCIEGNKKRGQ